MAWEHEGHTVVYVEHCVSDIQYTVVGATLEDGLIRDLRVREQSGDEMYADVVDDEAWCNTCHKPVLFDLVEWTCD